MKQALICFGFAIAIIAGLFFSSEVKADNVYYEHSATTSPSITYFTRKCIDVVNQELDVCSDLTGTTPGASKTFHLIQPIKIPISTYFPSLTISGFSWYTQSPKDSSNQAHVYHTYLLNDTDYANYVTNSYIIDTYRASSTEAYLNGEGETYNAPNNSHYENKADLNIPFTVNSTSDVTYVILEGVTQASPEGIQITLSEGTYPGIPWTNTDGSYTYDGTHYNLTSNYDFEFKIFTIDTPLAFTYPDENQVYNDYPMQFTGTCSNGVDLEVFDGTSYESSTNYFASSLLCTDNTFSYSTIMETGHWTATASSSNGYDEVSFYFVAMEYEDPTSIFFDPYYYATSTTSTEMHIFQQWGTNLSRLRPYSYFPQFIGAFLTAIDNATSSSPFPELDFSLANYNSSTAFNLNTIKITNLYDVMEQSDWTAIRPFMNIAIWVLFLFYIYTKIKRLI